MGEVQPAALLPMCSVSLVPQPVPQVPTGLPFSWQLTNQMLAQAPLVPVLIVDQAPFAPVNVVAAQFCVHPFSKSSAQSTNCAVLAIGSKAVKESARGRTTQ